MSTTYSFSDAAKRALMVGTVGGLGYFAAIVLTHFMNLSYTDAPDWIYRACIVISIMAAIWGYRLKLRGRINFRQGMIVGMLTGFILCLWMAGSTYAFRTTVAPDYESKYFDKYIQNMWNQNAVSYMKKRNLNKLSREDVIELNRTFSIFIGKQYYFFSMQGYILAILIFTNIWSLAVSGTIAYMARGVEKTKKNNSPPKKGGGIQQRSLG